MKPIPKKKSGRKPLHDFTSVIKKMKTGQSKSVSKNQQQAVYYSARKVGVKISFRKKDDGNLMFWVV